MPLTIGDLKKRIHASRTSQRSDLATSSTNQAEREASEAVDLPRTSLPLSTQLVVEEDTSATIAVDEDDPPESERAPSSARQETPAVLDARGATDFDLTHIALDLVRIDPHQPRHYLPTDLRARLVRGEVTSREALSELIERVRQEDAEATAWFEDIKALAESIADINLRQPMQVARIRDKSGQMAYRLIDGERRFWACLLLRATLPRHRAEDFETVAMLIEREEATGDDVVRAQWASNLQRAQIPIVDFAEFVMQVRDLNLRRMQVDEKPFRQQLGTEWASVPASEVVAELTAREIERVTKRQLSHRQIYRYCAVAEHLDDRAKMLARTGNSGLRQLLRISKLPAEEQVEAIRRSPSDLLDDTDDADPTVRRTDGEKDRQDVARGRPPTLDSQITLLTKLTMHVSKQRDRALRRADATKLQYLRQSVDEAIQSLTAYQRQIETYIAGGSAKDTGR